jgi:hypothetical protein
LGILTVNKPLSTLYTSGTRSVPGPSCSNTVLLLEHFGLYTTGVGEGEWFGIYARQAHIPKIPIKFDNHTYTELNIKKINVTCLIFSYLHIGILHIYMQNNVHNT